jgi:hypothetical protein
MGNLTLILFGCLIGHLLVRIFVEPSISERSLALRNNMYEMYEGRAAELDKKIDKLEKRIDNFPSL